MYNKDIFNQIMILIKNLPIKPTSYMCHGEFHSYNQSDYEKIEEKLKEILNNERRL